MGEVLTTIGRNLTISIKISIMIEYSQDFNNDIQDPDNEGSDNSVPA